MKTKTNELFFNDDAIEAINQGVNIKEEKSIFIRDKNKELHIINFDICVANFQSINNVKSKCVGDRDITNFVFQFYTSGLPINIVFKKKYIFNFFHKYPLKGSRVSRFHQLQKIIQDLGYTTYDLT